MTTLVRAFALLTISITSPCMTASLEPATTLASMIPSEAGMVSGMETTHMRHTRPSLFIPLPRKSWLDIDLFDSLCGADPSKRVDEVILVDSELNRSGYEHTLLSRGHFNSTLLYRSAIRRGATTEVYAGLTLVRMPPIAVGNPKPYDSSLLAIIDSRILVLGTSTFIKKEIDLFIAAHPPQPLIKEQVDFARRSDVWWILIRPSDTSMAKRALMDLDPAIAEAVMQTSVSVRMRYGKSATFEYQIFNPPDSEPPQPRQPFEPSSPGLNAFAALDPTIRRSGIIRIPSTRYRIWLARMGSPADKFR